MSLHQTYRKISTRRGMYFVPWKPEDVAQLLIHEKLAPLDLISNELAETHSLIRDLYLLACAGALSGKLNHRVNTTLLAQYARKLQTFLRTRH